MKLDYYQVDAFSSQPLLGNPCAVFFDADALDDATMQAIARETNLSETVFFQSPTDGAADYKVRIFTPRMELPFAGHPTIASAHAFLESGGKLPTAGARVLRQECGIGIVPVEVEGDGAQRRLTMTQATPAFNDVHGGRDTAAGLLNCSTTQLGTLPPAVVSTGIPWLVVQIDSAERLGQMQIDQGAMRAYNDLHGTVGLSVFSIGAAAEGCDVKVRAFARGAGVPEDPVTGSANGCIAAYIGRHRLLGSPNVSYVAEQGAELQRDGRVYAHCDASDDQAIVVRIGGEAVTVCRGVLTI